MTEKHQTINLFIQEELEYFSPMRERALATSTKQRDLWRSETVQERQRRVSREVYDLAAGNVLYGPFSGMRLSDSPWWGESDLGAQCLGLYEQEVLNQIVTLGTAGCQSFIDIGAADGYYAIGALFSNLFEQALCFEMSEAGRGVISENWVANGSPGQLEVMSTATEDALLALPSEILNSALVLIDIEGGEFELLTEQVLEKFSRATIIVEIHNWIENFESKYESMLHRADRHFLIHRLERVEKKTLGIPELRHFTDDNRLLLVSERRPCNMRFIKLSPKGLKS